jgi:excisionase family DNA binding protein
MFNPKEIAAVKDTTQFTIVEAARLIGVTYACFRNWVAKGKVEATKIGGRYTVSGLAIKKVTEQPVREAL